MNSSVLHRRRIERFAQLLDETGGARRHHLRSPIDEDLADYVAIGTSLSKATANVSVRESFRVDFRAQLMAAAERDGIGDTAVDNPSAIVGRSGNGTVHRSASALLLPKRRASMKPGRIRTRGAVLVGLAVGTLALSGISAASGDAMPGDTLYGMKRSQEGTELALARSATGKGHLYLDFAGTRLREAEAVHTNPHLLDNALADMDHETRLGVKILITVAVRDHDVAALRSVDQFVAGQRTQIDNLLSDVTGAARDRTLTSVALLDQVKVRAQAVHTALNCKTVVVIDTDTLGPQPAVSCQESTRVTPSTPIQPAPGRHATPTGKRTEATPTTPVGESGTPTPTGTPSAPPTGVETPSPVPTADDGLLGSIGHVLGGLLGH